MFNSLLSLLLVSAGLVSVFV